jgi:hypothetical protein
MFGVLTEVAFLVWAFFAKRGLALHYGAMTLVATEYSYDYGERRVCVGLTKHVGSLVPHLF